MLSRVAALALLTEQHNMDIGIVDAPAGVLEHMRGTSLGS